MFGYRMMPGRSAKSPLSTAFVEGMAFANVGGGNKNWSVSGSVINVPLFNSLDIANRFNVTAHGFAIPAYAIITGIELEVTRGNVGSGDNASTGGYRLLKAGSGVGSTQTDPLLIDLTGPYTDTFGSSSDLWGTTWTPAQINASNFGVQLQTITKNANDGLVVIPEINPMKLKIHYLG